MCAERNEPMNTQMMFARAVAGMAMAVLLYGLYWIAFHGEDYCWWHPEIDTVFSPGFSKAGFDKIQEGMTTDEVAELVGAPLWKTTDRDDPDMETWHFSHDGALGRWGDKAWFSYEVAFTNNHVSVKNRQIYYD